MARTRALLVRSTNLIGRGYDRVEIAGEIPLADLRIQLPGSPEDTRCLSPLIYGEVSVTSSVCSFSPNSFDPYQMKTSRRLSLSTPI